MRKPGLRGSFWPSERQELLLRAALLPREEALAAWDAATRWFDLDRLPVETIRLMPLLYKKLNALGVEPAVLPRLRGMYRRTWFLNQILVGRLRDIVLVLDSAAIPTLVLKGPAIALRYFDDLGERPMVDLDILVSFERVGPSLEQLATLGWHPGKELPPIETMRDRDHAITLTDSTGQICDLHWLVLEDVLLAPVREPSDLWWNAAVGMDLGEVSSRALCHADQLLHVMLHGARHVSGCTVQWVADAVAICRTAEIDWDRLVAMTQRMRAAVPVSDALRYLADTFEAPVPSRVVEELGGLPIRRADQVLHGVVSGRFGKRAGLVPFTIARYVRATSGRPVSRRIGGFLPYLQQAWDLDRLGSVPRVAVEKTVRALASSRVGDAWRGREQPIIRTRSPHHESPVPGARVNGVRIDPLRGDQVEGFMSELLSCGRSHVVHFISADPTVLAGRDTLFASLLEEGDLNLADGMSIVATLRVRGRRAQRITGSDAFPLLGAWGIDRGIRHYLLGAEPGVAEMLRIRLESEVPGMKIVGAETPPMGSIADWDLEQMAERVRASGAELLWVGVGTPKQQRLAARLRDLDAAPVILCVGAAFDFRSGAKRRPPVWMQRSGLEWLGRLIDEPRRLWRRYLIGNVAFLAGVGGDLLRERRQRGT